MSTANSSPDPQYNSIKNGVKEETSKMPHREKLPILSIIGLGILVYLNLLNYMDRYTLASVLTDIQAYFDISKKTAGLLQTVFVCSYMVFAPIFGYLGDRFPRKYVMAVGIFIWAGTSFAGSFMGSDQIVGFFLFRCLVGIGEASYSTVAPTIIADLFVGNQRSIALTVFYFAIPCGSGLGYIVGSKVAKALGSWKWAFRVTPGLGIVGVLLVLFVLREPKRGAKEISTIVAEDEDLSESVTVVSNHQGLREDLKQILSIPSFIWSTAGFTCVSFVVGALAFWAPDFALYAQQTHDYDKNRTLETVSYKFGIVTFISGILGVWSGAEIARRWRPYNEQADALVCAIGIITATPFLFVALYVADKYINLCWVLIAIGEILMCLNWAPNGDLLLYVTPPHCRSSAEAIQIVFIHVLGDAISPFIVGAISDSYTGGNPNAPVSIKHQGLLYALYITPFVSCFGSLFYFICAKHVPHDKAKAEAEALRQMGVPTKEVLDHISEDASATRTCYDTDDGVVPDDGEGLIKNEVRPDKVIV